MDAKNGTRCAVAAGVFSAASLFFAAPELAVAEDPSPGCLGECSNFRSAAEGWCGNCASHCNFDEAACTRDCNDRFSAWDEGPCIRDCEDGRLRDCYANCRGNQACEGWCGSDFLNGCRAGCNGVKNQRESDRQGCLNKCGGIKAANAACLDDWCDSGAPKRDRCYADVQAKFESCEAECRGNLPRCVNERCVVPFWVGECDGHTEIIGVCLFGTFKF